MPTVLTGGTIVRRRRGTSDILSLDSRRRIFEHVKHSPGVHLRQLQRDLSIPLGTLEYHLHRLEQRQLIVTRELNRVKAYFPVEGMDRRDRDILYFLRHEMPRRFSLLIADRPGISFQQLTQQVPVSPSTVSFHLKKLVDQGIIIQGKSGREKVYSAAEPDRIRRLVVQYRASFVDALVDRFADAWFDLRLGGTRLPG